MRRKKPKRPLLPGAVPKDWDQALRNESRGGLYRWLAHGAILFLLFGAPYLRGQFRARHVASVYAQVDSCMYGGSQQQAATRGSQPDNPSGYFAAMYFQQQADWPTRCKPALEELALAPAHLQFPSAKAAEADVQKAAQITLSELDQLTAANEADKVPLRPLWGLQMLRTAVEAYGSAAGVSATRSAAAQSTPVQASSVVPTPIPTWLDVDVGPEATIQLWGDDSVLNVAAFDRRGVSSIQLQPENTKRARLPKIGSLRTVVRHGDSEYLVWTAAADKCALSHCAGHSTGLAPMPVPLTKIPAPRWVAAHPFGSPSRSLTWSGDRMWMAAASLDGTPQLVEFTYAAATPVPTDNEQPAPILPVAKDIGHARDLIVFTNNSGQLSALALEQARDGQWELTQYVDGARRQSLLKLPQGWSSGWLRSCATQQPSLSEKRYFVVGTTRQAYFGTIADGAASTWAPLDVAIPAPAPTDRETQVALDCTTDGAITLAFIDSASRLNSATCTAAEPACTLQQVSLFATSVDVTHTGGGPLLAYSGAPEQPQLRLKHANEHGIVDAEAKVPGACWDRWGGMCGDPVFAWAGERLIVASRSGTGLMALESLDEGRTWSELTKTNLVNPPGPHVVPRVVAH